MSWAYVHVIRKFVMIDLYVILRGLSTLILGQHGSCDKWKQEVGNLCMNLLLTCFFLL